MHPQDTANDGDVVVALLGEEATVKRFFRETDHVRLQPENEAMEPIRSKEVKVLGRVVGLLGASERSAGARWASLPLTPRIARASHEASTFTARRYALVAVQARQPRRPMVPRGKSGHHRAGWSSDRPGETRGKVPQKQTAEVRRPT